MDEYVSRIAAQKRLGCSKEKILKLLRSGEIASMRKENGGWLVSCDSLEAYYVKRKDRIMRISKLQDTINLLRDENRYLKSLLNDAGIHYAGESNDIQNKSLSGSVTKLDLPISILSLLVKNGIRSIDQLCKMSLDDLKRLDGIGAKRALIIMNKLKSSGFWQ